MTIRKTVISLENLDEGFILTPERYETKKMQNTQIGVPLYKLCSIVKNSLSPHKADSNINYLLLDTGDVKEGFIRFKKVINASDIGSTKKIIKPGDVIVSRLRSYLRQVGYVDQDLFDSLPRNTILLCSSEFFVLRSDSDISYLAIFLLTSKAQKVFSSAQEGGHHPRFTQKTLEYLKVDQEIISRKKEISLKFKAAIASSRKGEQEVIRQLSNFWI